MLSRRRPLLVSGLVGALAVAFASIVAVIGIAGLAELVGSNSSQLRGSLATVSVADPAEVETDDSHETSITSDYNDEAHISGHHTKRLIVRALLVGFVAVVFTLAAAASGRSPLRRRPVDTPVLHYRGLRFRLRAPPRLAR